MKKAFWVLALGALASAIMAAGLGRAEEPAKRMLDRAPQPASAAVSEQRR
jgi:hypothetical protein